MAEPTKATVSISRQSGTVVRIRASLNPGTAQIYYSENFNYVFTRFSHISYFIHRVVIIVSYRYIIIYHKSTDLF